MTWPRSWKYVINFRDSWVTLLAGMWTKKRIPVKNHRTSIRYDVLRPVQLPYQPPIIPPIYKLIIWVLISIVTNTFQMFFFPLEHCLSLVTNYFFTFLNHFLIIYFEKEKLIYPGSRNSNQPFEQYSTVDSTLPWLIVIIPWLNVILCGSINSI